MSFGPLKISAQAESKIWKANYLMNHKPVLLIVFDGVRGEEGSGDHDPTSSGYKV
jgi:hypothetical protein